MREDIDSEERLGRLLAINLAGRAAEKTVCGLVSAGSGGAADSDLAKATAMALAMETRLGFGADQPLLHLDLGEPGTALGWRPDLAARVDARLEAAYAEACRLSANIATGSNASPMPWSRQARSRAMPSRAARRAALTGAGATRRTDCRNGIAACPHVEDKSG